MLRKIVIVQCEVGRQLTTEENLLIFKQRPDFVILPEYYNVDPILRDNAHNVGVAYKFDQYCRTLSDRLDTVLIAGTAVTMEDNGFFNTGHVYNRGRLVGIQHKLEPTANERAHGISPGHEQTLFEIDGIRFTLLICADVLNPENFIRSRELEPDIVFVPTTSPLRPHENVLEKFDRDHTIFIMGARAAGGYIVKCCAVGRIWGGALQGRSLAAAPWGIITRISPDEEDRPRILSCLLDITGLREFRQKQRAQQQDTIR
jgi:omega-amidase